MLKSLRIDNLTVFRQAKLEFGRQLNVFVGENGSGKTHALKVLYCVLAASAEEQRRANGSGPTKTHFQSRLAAKLVAVFRPESLGRLVRRQPGRQRCDVQVVFHDRKLNTRFHFATSSKTEVGIDRMPTTWVDDAPAYLPTRELLTIYPGFLSVYDGHYLEFEETWRDLCFLLGLPLVRGPREAVVKKLLEPLEESMGGKIELDRNGRFYLKEEGGSRVEMPLVAEGMRKLAMVARLIATGALLDKGYLFWDEPDANLNPHLIRGIARTILHLCSNNIQVFIATHSLFLLREIEILARDPEFSGLDCRYFGLHRVDGEVSVQQGPGVDDIGTIVALDETIEQADRYLEMEA